ncbi:hypothetical protein AVANS_1435 [Campylobacter sp. RM5004]|nr:hypothetical protein AVANS_1435 [Campylobacter sp. RM5004]
MLVLILNLIGAICLSKSLAKIALIFFALAFVSVFFTASFLLNFMLFFSSLFSFCILQSFFRK